MKDYWEFLSFQLRCGLMPAAVGSTIGGLIRDAAPSRSFWVAYLAVFLLMQPIYFLVMQPWRKS